jgi:transposase
METDPKQLAQLGDERLQCTEEQVVDALTGRAQPLHRAMLGLQLERLHLIDRQIAKLNSMIAQAMKPHQEAVMRLAEVPGLGVDSAQQIIAEVGVQASAFTSAAELTSWVGPVPARRKVRRKTTAVALPKATNICGECYTRWRTLR